MQLLPFSNLYGATSSFILTDFFSPEEIINTSIEDLIQILNEKSNGRFKDSEATANLLKQAAINSYRLDQVSLLPINLAITSSINCIKSFENEIKAVSKEIASLTKGLNESEYLSLTSIKGIGQHLLQGSSLK